MSENYIANSRRKLRSSLLYFMIKLFPLIKKWRIFRLKFSSKKVRASKAECKITSNLESNAKHFQKNKWAFVENILDKDFYNELLTNWPKHFYLDPPRKYEKSYNIGFVWNYGDNPKFPYWDPYGQHPILVKFLNYLRSPEFAVRMSNFAQRDLVLYNFVLNDAHAGSEVYPHKDGNYFESSIQYNLNIVFFVDATGGENSGGLTLSRDNELKDIIFEPKNLQNSGLIYDVLGDFYHGFPQIAKGKFRWAITAQFIIKDFVKNN